MNNGVRVSIILAVITIAMLGLYYASLDDPAATVGTTTEPPAQEVILETDLDPQEATVVEPIEVVEVVEESDADVASEPAELVLSEPGPETSMDDPLAPRFDDEVVAEEPDSSDLDPMEADEDTVETGLEDALEDGGDSGAAEVDLDADEPSNAVEPETGLEEAVEVEDPRADLPGVPLGRSVDRIGVGMHRVVLADDPSIDLTRAVRLLQSREQGNLSDDPTGTAWVVVPDGLGDRLSETAITESQNGQTLVLVRSDRAGVLDLSGDVSSARVVLEADGIHHGVNFRIRPPAIGSVSEASLNLVRVPIVWLQDGRMVLAEKRPISINGQGRIAGRFDRPTADRLAAGLLSESAEPTEPVAETPSTDSGVDADAPQIATNPGTLPAEAYVEYTIQPNETFSSIASDWFGDASRYSEIGLANPLVDPKRLQAGQVIKLPPRDLPRRVVVAPANSDGIRTHIVRSGETLSDIALAAYGKSSRWIEIYEANKDMIGQDSSRLEVGMKLVIP